MPRILSLLLAVASCGTVYAQTPAAQDAPEMTTQNSPATFKTKVNLVLVPVVVRDAQGHAVGTLKQDNFHLFDKGKPQVISRFSVEKAGGNTSKQKESAGGEAAVGAENGKVGDLDTAAVIPQRYIAFLFDDLNVQFGDLARVQKAATHHLATTLQPTDRAAIFTTSGQGNLDFTDDKAKLEEAVMRLHPRPMYAQSAHDCPYMTYYMADRIINKNDQIALQTATQDTIVCESLQGPGAQQSAHQMVQASAASVLQIGEQGSRVTLDTLKNVVRRLSIMPGQRTIILVSPGFLTLTSEAFEDKTDILDRAARANVIISALDARGLYTGSEFDASQRGSYTTQMSIQKAQYLHESDMANSDVMAELADGTGGLFFQNNNDLEAGLKRVAAAPEYVYLLGFSPQNLKLDGSFHRLKVTVADANGLTLQARRGYYAPKHMTSEEETAKAEIQEAVFSREETHDLPVDLHTQFFKPDPADAKLTVLARMNLQHLRFKKLDGRNCNDLTVVTALFDRNGNYVTATSKTIAMKLRDETLARLASGITVRTSFDVKPGTYVIRLVVRDTEGQTMTAENGAVDIP